jgi:hypothetical protein
VNAAGAAVAFVIAFICFSGINYPQRRPSNDGKVKHFFWSRQMEAMPCAVMGIEISVHCAELCSGTKVSLELHIAPPPLAPLSMMC